VGLLCSIRVNHVYAAAAPRARPATAATRTNQLNDMNQTSPALVMSWRVGLGLDLIPEAIQHIANNPVGETPPGEVSAHALAKLGLIGMGIAADFRLCRPVGGILFVQVCEDSVHNLVRYTFLAQFVAKRTRTARVEPLSIVDPVAGEGFIIQQPGPLQPFNDRLYCCVAKLLFTVT